MNDDLIGKHPIDDLCDLAARLDDVYRVFAKRYGETYLSMWCIEELGKRPEGLTQKQICELLYLPKQTTSSMVSSLENRGLVLTEPSKTDKRSKVHMLTSAGRAIYEKVSVDMDRCNEAAVNEVGEAALAEAIGLMGKALDCVDRMLEEEIVEAPQKKKRK